MATLSKQAASMEAARLKRLVDAHSSSLEESRQVDREHMAILNDHAQHITQFGQNQNMMAGQVFRHIAFVSLVMDKLGITEDDVQAEIARLNQEAKERQEAAQAAAEEEQRKADAAANPAPNPEPLPPCKLDIIGEGIEPTAECEACEDEGCDIARIERGELSLEEVAARGEDWDGREPQE